MKAETIKTVFLTTLIVLSLVGGLLWIADRVGNTAAPSSNQTSTGTDSDWDAAYNVIVNSEYHGTVFPGQSIQIEVICKPRVKSLNELYNKISAEVDREWSTGIWSAHECDVN